MISVIDMPPPEESAWWRGKRGFEVGFFPCEYVEVINNGAAGGAGGPGGGVADNVANSVKSSTVPKGLSLSLKSGGKDVSAASAPAAVLGGGGGGGSDGDASSDASSSSATPPFPHHHHARGHGHQPSKPVLRKHGKLISFFRSFILSRPARERVKKRGILRERVFGCDLSEHLAATGQDGEKHHHIHHSRKHSSKSSKKKKIKRKFGFPIRCLR